MEVCLKSHSRTDRYDIICSLLAHDKIQPAYEDDEISIGDRLIPKHATPEALEALVDTLNFIDIWLKLFEYNYDSRCLAYITAMKYMFNQIPLMMNNALTPKQKVQKLIIEISGRW